MNANIDKQLNNVFGFDSFQTGQAEIIKDILQKNNVLGILPTGSGKSLCYQLPATIVDGLVIVISPLISLMIDQVRQIKAYYFKEVAAIYSFQSRQEKEKVLSHLHQYKLLFVSPELLQQDYILNRLMTIKINVFCIDEAHCISQWGYDFRTDYMKLNIAIQILKPDAVLALTGTASELVRNDIQNKLGLTSMKKHIYSMTRKNISLVVDELEANEEEKITKLIRYIKRLEWPLIIYFSSRKSTEYITERLSSELPIANIAYYHAGLNSGNRLKIQEQFINGQLDIICSTSAFGMGINKKDIRTVIHYHPPTQIESFIQEIGRAGRDGKNSVSVLLYRNIDFKIPETIIKNELPDTNEIRAVYDYLKNYEDRIQDASLINALNIDEVKWRFIKYHFESKGMIEENMVTENFKTYESFIEELIAFCTKRVAYKQKKLNEVKSWVNSKGCLHQNLYSFLEENVESLAENCCSHCGIDLPEENDSTTLKRNGELGATWQNILAERLLIEEINNEKKPS